MEHLIDRFVDRVLQLLESSQARTAVVSAAVDWIFIVFDFCFQVFHIVFGYILFPISFHTLSILLIICCKICHIQ